MNEEKTNLKDLVSGLYTGERIARGADFGIEQRIGGYSSDETEEHAYISFHLGLKEGRTDALNYFQSVTPFPAAKKGESTREHFNRMNHFQRIYASLNLDVILALASKTPEHQAAMIRTASIELEREGNPPIFDGVHP